VAASEDQETRIAVAEQANTRRASSTPVALGRTLGLDETWTKPLSVSGQVAQPAAPLAANHLRVAAW
jgi:hypothetical protein